MSRETGIFWHFFPILMVFRSLCLSRAILAHQTSNGMFSGSRRIFWCPWGPWGQIHIDLNKNSVWTGCVITLCCLAHAKERNGHDFQVLDFCSTNLTLTIGRWVGRLLNSRPFPSLAHARQLSQSLYSLVAVLNYHAVFWLAKLHGTAQCLIWH